MVKAGDFHPGNSKGREWPLVRARRDMLHVGILTQELLLFAGSMILTPSGRQPAYVGRKRVLKAPAGRRRG